MKTCSAAIAIIIKLSIMLRLKILRSVLRTVLKLRFSRVRKYFWLRVIVESWPESLKMDSSRAEVCSGEVPCLDGKLVRSSFSTWRGIQSALGLGAVRCTCPTHSYLEIHKFLGEGAHLIVETEPVLPNIISREDKVSLAFLLAVHHDLLVGADNFIVDIE